MDVIFGSSLVVFSDVVSMCVTVGHIANSAARILLTLLPRVWYARQGYVFRRVVWWFLTLGKRTYAYGISNSNLPIFMVFVSL